MSEVKQAMIFQSCIITGDAICDVKSNFYSVNLKPKCDMITKDESTLTTTNAIQLGELPSVILEHVCSYMDHKTLHAVEATSTMLRQSICQTDLWKHLLLSTTIVATNHCECDYTWKQMGCLAKYRCGEETLLKGVLGYSSADRPSESPQNTLQLSRCWPEINKFQDLACLDTPHSYNAFASFTMTLGERIQMKCGCSTGNSCYWSSSASLDKNALEYIDYTINGPCIIRCVQIIPYRVFWHPGSPTYAPQRVYFEFYELHESGGTPTVFYRSPKYAVQNDMKLQEFELPQKVWTSKFTILRIHFIGRHQAQTFELPQRLHRTLDDAAPKYYVCLSYVNAIGLSQVLLQSPIHEIQTPTSRGELPIFSSTLIDCMTACYEGLVERYRGIH